MASHATEKQCWVTTIRTSNLSTNLCDCEIHYEVWGIIFEVLTVLFTDGNSSLLRCNTVSLNVHFQHSAGPWCLHCDGQTVQVESSTLKTEALQLLKMSATAHTMTQHHMWHYIPADQNLDTIIDHIMKFIKTNNHTNIVLANVPIQYDLSYYSPVNKGIRSYNKKLMEITYLFTYLLHGAESFLRS